MSGKKLVEMTWDPVTRVIGSLGIHTRIDFDNREVAECRATSSIFRGYSVFLRGKDPRDAHFITRDRKSTRLNSSHTVISYAVFCLKKKTNHQDHCLARSCPRHRCRWDTPARGCSCLTSASPI